MPVTSDHTVYKVSRRGKLANGVDTIATINKADFEEISEIKVIWMNCKKLKKYKNAAKNLWLRTTNLLYCKELQNDELLFIAIMIVKKDNSAIDSGG